VESVILGAGGLVTVAVPSVVQGYDLKVFGQQPGSAGDLPVDGTGSLKAMEKDEGWAFALNAVRKGLPCGVEELGRCSGTAGEGGDKEETKEQRSIWGE